MPASLQLETGMSISVPPGPGAADVLELRTASSYVLAAVTDTLLGLRIVPDDNLSGDHQEFEFTLHRAALAVTADAGTDKLTAAGHGLAAGQAGKIEAGTVPGGLVADTVYYVVNPATNDFQLALSQNGAPLNLTTTGATVTFRPYGATVPFTTPYGPPGVPIVQRLPGGLLDFSRIKGLQLTLLARDPGEDALGSIYLKCGDPSDAYNHLNLALHLDHTGSAEQLWPSATLPLPAGFVLDPSWPLKLYVKPGESNVNLLILLNLLGN